MNLTVLEDRRRRHRNLSALWGAQFINTAGLMMLVPIMPLYMERLGAQPHLVGLWAGAAVAAPALPLALSTPLWGRLGDRIGRKWMVVRALVGLAAAMAVMAVASTPEVFVLARLLQGALGGVVEAAAAFIGADGDDEGRGSALGRSYSATAAGALIGPVAGGLLVTGGDLRLLMAVIVVVALVLAVVCAVVLHERRHISTPAMQQNDRKSPKTKGWLRAALSSIGIPVLAVAFLTYFGVYGLIPVYAQYVEALIDEPQAAGPWIGGLHAIMWTGTFVGSFWWGRHNDRNGSPQRTLLVAAAATSIAIVLQALIPWPLLLAPLRFIQGFYFAALAQSVFLYASGRAPSHQRAGYVGAANSFLLAGQFVGPLMAGAILAFIAPGSAVIATGAVVGAAVLIGGIAVRRHQAPPLRDGAVDDPAADDDAQSPKQPEPGAPRTGGSHR